MARSTVVVKHRRCSDVILLRAPGRNLDRRDLTGAYLPFAALAGQRCRGARFTRATLRSADLRGADLRRADLRQANLTSADLRQADLRGADLSGAILTDADIQGARSNARTRWPAGFQPPAPDGAAVPRGEAWLSGTAYLVSRWVTASALPSAVTTVLLVAAAIGAVLTARAPVEPGLRPSSGRPVVSAVPPRSGARQEFRRAGRSRIARVRSARRPPIESLHQEPARSGRGKRRRASQRALSRRLTRVTRLRRSPKLPSSRLARADRPARPRFRLLAQSTPRFRKPLRRAHHMARVALRRERVAGVRAAAARPLRRVARRPHWRPDARLLRYAYGNPGFHYGSGYDIYRMHLR